MTLAELPESAGHSTGFWIFLIAIGCLVYTAVGSFVGHRVFKNTNAYDRDLVGWLGGIFWAGWIPLYLPYAFGKLLSDTLDGDER